MLARSAIVNRNSPTHLPFPVLWALVTLADFTAFVLLLVVSLVGGLVRLPGARTEIAAVVREQLRPEDAES